MPTITSANVANAIIKLVAADALPALAGNLVMGNLVNRDYEPVLANAGDTVNIPIPPTLIANNLAEGGSVQTQNPNIGNAQVILNTHAEATFQIPDVTKALASPDLLALYMQPAIVALAEKIETDLLSLYSQFTGNDALGGASTPLTEDVIDSAETTLFKAKVPQSERKYLILSADAYSDVRKIARFTENQSIASGEAILSGQVGKIKDFTVMRSQYVVKTAGGLPTTHNLAFTKNSMALVVRRLPKPLPGTGAIAEYAEMGNFGLRVVMSYAPNTLAQQITVDVLYGCAVLRNNFGVQVLS